VKISVIDDWQDLAQGCADWSGLQRRATIAWHTAPLGSVAATVATLADSDIIVPMRERTQFDAELLRQLPKLRLLALTGRGLKHVDVDYCNAQGIVCCGSGTYTPAATAELALGLMLAAARGIAHGDARMRVGEFQQQVAPGYALEGLTLGIIGVGRIGARVAAYGRALGMQVLGWNRTLTVEQAAAAGVSPVSRDELLRRSDVVSLHVTYSKESHHLLGTSELALLKPGALLVNTARGPLVDAAALLAALQARRIHAALDVYDEEPLPPGHPLRSAPNTLLTPHIGFGTRATFESFYRESVENIQAFLQRAPLRVLNPDALARVRWID
jgi:phosphoglycerate dehydrogenase-like enzyme